MPACLYIVATPIGHLGDITLRALEVLKAVHCIAAEDTRHSAKLMRHFGIDTPMVSYHDHSPAAHTERLLRYLLDGQSVALVSDAGTPLISDPGYKLVEACQQHGFQVIPIPGASAMTAALSASGLPTDRFYFEGFLPVKAGQRGTRIKALKRLDATLVLFEAPRRVLSTLEVLIDELGDRDAALCRELTKAHETIYRGSLSALHLFVRNDANQQRGEMVLVIRGCDSEAVQLSAEVEALLDRLVKELPPRRAASVVADVTGLPVRVLYQAILDKK